MSISRAYSGTGLGLSLCKRLVELMGGEMGMEGVPAKGSTFWLTVPLQLPPVHSAGLVSEASVPATAMARTALDQTPPAQPGRERPLDTERLLPRLSQLARMLDDGESRARHLSREVASLLVGTGLAPSYARIDQAIAALDFPKALERLRQLADEQEWSLS